MDRRSHALRQIVHVFTTVARIVGSLLLGERCWHAGPRTLKTNGCLPRRSKMDATPFGARPGGDLRGKSPGAWGLVVALWVRQRRLGSVGCAEPSRHRLARRCAISHGLAAAVSHSLATMGIKDPFTSACGPKHLRQDGSRLWACGVARLE